MVLDANDESTNLDNKFKDLTKEVQALNNEKEGVEKRRKEAIKELTALELDLKDLEEKIYGNQQAKVVV